MFRRRSEKLERIDTGNYTDDEYAQFLREIRFINRYFGDARALKKTLLREIEKMGVNEFSVLDVGAGSGELLRVIAKFARKTGRKAALTGLDLNQISALSVAEEGKEFPEIISVRADALVLPFANDSFDFAISSLFFHHLTNEQIVVTLKEMSRVARRGIYVIDLHRHPAAFVLYKLFCTAFRISPLVREDGSLSILRGFKPGELQSLSDLCGIRSSKIERTMPFRLVMRGG